MARMMRIPGVVKIRLRSYGLPAGPPRFNAQNFGSAARITDPQAGSIVVVLSLVSVEALEGVFEDEFGDCRSGRLAVFAGCTEVNASVDACVRNLSQSRGKVGEGTGDAEHHVGVHGEGAVFAEVMRQYGCPGGAEGGMARRILRVRRCNDERRPVGIADGRGVSVGVGQGDGGDGPPEDVVVLRLPA